MSTAMIVRARIGRVAVIGAAVYTLPAETRDQMLDVPWAAVAGLRNAVVQEYFRVDRDLILDNVDNQLGRWPTVSTTSDHTRRR